MVSLSNHWFILRQAQDERRGYSGIEPGPGKHVQGNGLGLDSRLLSMTVFRRGGVAGNGEVGALPYRLPTEVSASQVGAESGIYWPVWITLMG